MPISAVVSEPGAARRLARVRALLFLPMLMAGLPAGIAGDDLFIGQFAVEDARQASQRGQELHYRIVHADPALLESQLAGRSVAVNRGEKDVSFSLDAYPVAQAPAVDAGHLAATFLVDYTEPAVQALRSRIEQRYGARPSPAELEAFVYEYIDAKDVTRGFDVASVVAQSRSGDCSEHAVLLTALLRMYGYPARTVLGVYVSLTEPVRGYGHAWAEYRGATGWTGVDGTRIDDGVGARHLPLAVLGDESVAYRMAVVGALRYLSIDSIRVE